MKKLLSKIKGWKKITAALIGLLAALLGPELLGLEPEIVENIIQTLSFYLVGQGAADMGEHMNLSKREKNG